MGSATIFLKNNKRCFYFWCFCRIGVSHHFLRTRVYKESKWTCDLLQSSSRYGGR